MTTKNITTVAMIAAIYVLLTYLFAPLSFNYIQFRISEVLTVLPFFTRLAIPGLFIGTIISNLLSPAGIYDVVFGSLATLLAAYLTSLTKNRFLAPLPPVIVNAVIIGVLLGFIGGLQVGIPWLMLYVGFGELGVCYLLGLPFIFLLERYQHVLPWEKK
ncbi:QueT transporter family protein [Shimazuella sp. AN120528]|uniref:QueT transporter family protein n=1 Tax=Shimazuella soli TaxID=1892854 RepID=UPI001F0E63A5|nr:QueT transporter family protein [Shimazuella soli]MCH5585667.1 QueT transporter family protein [Shimazuella soli]